VALQAASASGAATSRPDISAAAATRADRLGGIGPDLVGPALGRGRAPELAIVGGDDGLLVQLDRKVLGLSRRDR
jgi:hypothetical protein